MLHGMRLAVAVLTAVALTCASCWYEQRGPELMVVGNVCGPHSDEFCYEPVLKGGFPFAYVYDSPGVSVQGKLSIGEDRLSLTVFTLDVLVYLLALRRIAQAFGRRRRHIPGDPALRANSHPPRDPQ